MALGINVTYRVKPGAREEFMLALEENKIRECVLAEAGCLQYDYYLCAHRPDEILLVERWENAAAQALHMTQPHMTPLNKLKERLVEDVLLVKYQL